MQTPLNNRPAPSNTVLLWIADTALLAASYIVAAIFVHEDLWDLYLLYDGGLVQILAVTLVIQIGLWIEMLYSSPVGRSRTHLVMSVVRILGAAFLSQVFWFYVNPAVQIPLQVMFGGSTLVLILLPLWRLFFARLQNLTAEKWRLLLVGEVAHSPLLAVSAETAPFVIAGVLDTNQGISRENTLSQLEKLVETCKPTHVVIAGNPPFSRELLNLQWSGMRVVNAAEFYEDTFRRVPLEDSKAAQGLFREAVFSTSLTAPTSSGVTVAIALLLGLLLLPLALLLAVAIKLSSPGPVLVRLPRLGQFGKPFELIRFRVPMRSGQGEVPTWLGRIMTGLGLHRLPELWKVIRGEIGFIGPRPLDPQVARELETQIPLYGCRRGSLPGMLGWAQLNLAQPVADPLLELSYDLYYLKNQDTILKLYILGHSLNTFRSL